MTEEGDTGKKDAVSGRRRDEEWWVVVEMRARWLVVGERDVSSVSTQ